MRFITASLSLLLLSLLAACSSVEVKVGDMSAFTKLNANTYSWRTEPFSNGTYSRDPIYVIDPILREVVDRELQAKGFVRQPRGGDFTVDYIYAPGFRMGADSELTSNVSPRAGVRPNTRVSGAERDNAIALTGVRETRNIRIGFNDGQSGLEVWNAIITKLTSNVNEAQPDQIRSALNSGVKRAFADLPGPSS